MATSAIEGQVLNPESVRSSVLRKLGINILTEGGAQSKNIDGLVDVTQDAQSAVKLFSLSNQMMEKRTDYYDALNSAQHGDMDISE